MAMIPWPLGASVAVTLVFVVWAVLPCLLGALGLGTYRATTAGGPSDSEPEDDRYHDLLALEFEFVGTVWEEVFRQRTTLYVLVQPAEKCRACFYQYGREWRLFLATQLAEGAAVVTTHYPRERTESASLLACGLPGVSIAELLEAHRQQVERFRAVGIEPSAMLGLEDAVLATRALHYNPSVQRRHTRLLMASFLIRLAIFGGVPALVGTITASVGSSVDISWSAAMVSALVMVVVPPLIGLLIRRADTAAASSPYRVGQQSGKKGDAVYSKGATRIGAARHGG
jgi:hypothetical protein